MSQSVLPHRVKTGLTPQESEQLLGLYAELSDLASQAREAVKSAGHASGSALKELRDIDVRITGKIDSVKAIVR
jgi:hypothetical protein